MKESPGEIHWGQAHVCHKQAECIMQSSTCLQQIRPFGKRDEAMYKTAADISLRHHIKINLAIRAVSISETEP